MHFNVRGSICGRGNAEGMVAAPNRGNEKPFQGYSYTRGGNAAAGLQNKLRSCLQRAGGLAMPAFRVLSASKRGRRRHPRRDCAPGPPGRMGPEALGGARMAAGVGWDMASSRGSVGKPLPLRRHSRRRLTKDLLACGRVWLRRIPRAGTRFCCVVYSRTGAAERSAQSRTPLKTRDRQRSAEQQRSARGLQEIARSKTRQTQQRQHKCRTAATRRAQARTRARCLDSRILCRCEGS
jgi:hypothetical protein